MGNIASGELNTFVDGQIVSANDATYGLNPKMEVIRAAVNDNDSRIAVLEGQIGSVGGLFFNVKASPYNAVGDGIADDTIAIQSAVVAASAVSGTVVVPKGTYKLTDSITIAGSCVIQSDGLGQSSILQMTVIGKPTLIINSSNVSILYLKFDQKVTGTGTVEAVISSTTASAASYYSRIVVDNCTFYTSNATYPSPAITLYFASNAQVSNCVFNYNGYTGIGVFMSSCIDSIIYKNSFSKMQYDIRLVRTSGSIATYPQCKNIVIEKNTFSNTYSRPIELYSTTSCVVSQNTFVKTDTTATSFRFINTTAVDALDNTYLEIINNTIDGTNATLYGTLRGLNLDYIDQSIISGNTLIECGVSLNGAVYLASNVKSITIISNLFFRCFSVGISIGVTPSVSNQIIISNNNFTDVYSTSSGTTAIFDIGLGALLSITGNVISRGSKSATYVNETGFYTAISTNGAYINYSGNNFSKATTPISLATSSTICMYYEEPTGDRVFRGTGVPTTGTFNVGDKVILTSPTAGGYIGYVCTTAGTPGTWKGFGAIQA